MTSPSLEQVMQRIAKLLALAEDKSNPHESATAAALAQQLMTRYSVDAATVAAATGEAEADLGEMTTEEILSRGGIVPLWQRLIAGAVTRVNGCKMLFRSSHGHLAGLLLIIGRERDARMARYLTTWLFAEIERLLVRAKDTGGPRASGRAWCNSFRMGAADIIAQRLLDAHQAQRARIAASARATGELAVVSTALATLDRRYDEAERHARDKFQPKDTRSRTVEVDAQAYHAGRRAGARVQLESQAVADLGHATAPA